MCRNDGERVVGLRVLLDTDVESDCYIREDDIGCTSILLSTLCISRDDLIVRAAFLSGTTIVENFKKMYSESHTAVAVFTVFDRTQRLSADLLSRLNNPCTTPQHDIPYLYFRLVSEYKQLCRLIMVFTPLNSKLYIKDFIVGDLGIAYSLVFNLSDPLTLANINVDGDTSFDADFTAFKQSSGIEDEYINELMFLNGLYVDPSTRIAYINKAVYDALKEIGLDICDTTPFKNTVSSITRAFKLYEHECLYLSNLKKARDILAKVGDC